MPVFLAYAFRIFFPLAALYAALVIFVWLGVFLKGWAVPLAWSPPLWHSHEMIFGFVPAAIAGFVLTAISNWTAAPPLAGRSLLYLVLLWLAGRCAMLAAAWVPSWLVMLLDNAFLLVLGLYVGWVIISQGNKRNLVVVLAIALLLAGNLLMHLGGATGDPTLLRSGQRLGLDTLTLLMVIIGGRIIPAFSANWLRQRGGEAGGIRVWPALDIAAVISVLCLALVALSPLPERVAGVVALTAAFLNGIRLAGWSGWRTWREPLLWILHVAYLWLVLALLLRGLFAWGVGPQASLWQHALGAGAMGTLILGVMTRVATGHTGRPLRLVRGGLTIYIAVTLAAIVRVLAAGQWVDYRSALTVAGVAWIAAFILFALLYGKILGSRRPDGRPG